MLVSGILIVLRLLTHIFLSNVHQTDLHYRVVLRWYTGINDCLHAASSSNTKLKRNDEGDFYADVSNLQCISCCFAIPAGALESTCLFPVYTYQQLDKYKRVTVRQFKDKTLIDIREYYTDKNTEMQKPGKKGIALSVEAWKALKGVMSAVSIRNGSTSSVEWRLIGDSILWNFPQVDNEAKRLDSK